MKTISLGDAQSRLADLIGSLMPGEEIIITEAERPVARLTVPTSLRDFRPASVGAVLCDPFADADLLDEMLDDDRA